MSVCQIYVQPSCRLSASGYSIHFQLTSISGDPNLHPEPEDVTRHPSNLIYVLNFHLYRPTSRSFVSVRVIIITTQFQITTLQEQSYVVGYRANFVSTLNILMWICELRFYYTK